MNKTDKLPKLRDEIQIFEFNRDSDKYIVLVDPSGYALQTIELPGDIVPFMSALSGEFTYQEFEDSLIAENGEVDISKFIEYFYEVVKILDYNAYLETPMFEWQKQDVDTYLSSVIRPPVCSGSSYPKDKEELTKMMDNLFNSVELEDIKPGAKMIIVPHIDFRIGEGAFKCYASGYHSLRGQKPDLVVIFGTSHYSNSAHFMLTEKHFETPLGTAISDSELIHFFNNYENEEVVFDEMAHRNEHSIELQVVLAQHFFSNPNLKIFPVLTGSFHDFMNEDSLPITNSEVKSFIVDLKEQINKSGKKAVYITSVDFSHIGRKFGDDFDAETKLEKVRQDDELLIRHLANCDADSFFKEITQNGDKNKVCGLSPIYSMMKMVKPDSGRFLHYHQWNEIETKSAVTFAGLSYY